jgi:vacuolar-type H+-ATPase subunit D/Vma8
LLRLRGRRWANLSAKLTSPYSKHTRRWAPLKVEAAAATTPPSIEVKVSEKIVLGIRIPTLEVSSTKLPLNYGFLDTAAAFDEAVTKFRDILVPICRVAEVENTILRLAEELKKTQRLLNALEHLIIPVTRRRSSSSPQTLRRGRGRTLPS